MTISVSNLSPLPTEKDASGSFRTDIEGLRAIAVLLVVAYHAGVPGLRGGFVGVDVFFVLSGYLITGLLFNELTKTGTISFLRFYARRVRRLLPASALTVLATIATVHFVLSPLEQIKLVRSAISTVAYFSNFYFAHSTRDYFASDTATNPLLHTWSLAVEEQFYCLWPLLIFLAYRINRSRRYVAGCLAALSIVSLIYCILYTKENPGAAFFLSPARAWQFGVGGLLSLVPVSRFSAHRRAANLLGFLGLGGVLLAAHQFSPLTHFPGYAALLPSLATLAALVAGIGAPGKGIARGLNLPVMQRLGQLSYSIYLWHWPVLVLVAARVQPFTPMVRAACVAAAIAIAAFTHYLIENPIRFNRSLLPRPRLTLAMAGVVTLASLGTVVIWRQSVRSLPQYAALFRAVNDEPRLYEMGCSAGFTEAKPKECSFGHRGAATKVVLFGDSHAAQWAPALEQLADERSWELVTFVKNACPAVDVPAFDSRYGNYVHECAQWRKDALERIVAEHPALVVMGSRARYSKNTPSGVQPLSDDDWRNGTARTMDQLTKAGIAVLLVGDTPRPGFDVPDCLARTVWTGSGHCGPFPLSSSLNGSVFRAQEEAARNFQRVALLDLNSQICTGESCDVMRNGIIIYRDNDHVTASFARSLAPLLASALPSFSVPERAARTQ
jgi:peptidoglycan/LPS O-acetylase OafA/YrhL